MFVLLKKQPNRKYGGIIRNDWHLHFDDSSEVNEGSPRARCNATVIKSRIWQNISQFLSLKVCRRKDNNSNWLTKHYQILKPQNWARRLCNFTLFKKRGSSNLEALELLNVQSGASFSAYLGWARQFANIRGLSAIPRHTCQCLSGGRRFCKQNKTNMNKCICN